MLWISCEMQTCRGESLEQLLFGDHDTYRHSRMCLLPICHDMWLSANTEFLVPQLSGCFFPTRAPSATLSPPPL